MCDSPFKEDADTKVAEGGNMTPHFEVEVLEPSVGFSESQMPTAQESAQTQESDTSSVSSKAQEEEGAPALLESNEDLSCEKGFCSDVEKEAEESKQAEVEISTLPISLPLRLHEQEEEACEVEGQALTSQPLSGINGECHTSDTVNEFPALIRCFQVVNINSEYVISSSWLHFLGIHLQTLQQAYGRNPYRRIIFRWSEVTSKTNQLLNFLQSVQIIPILCTSCV